MPDKKRSETAKSRCAPPRTPCMRPFGDGAGKCPPPRTPCMRSFGAGASRCPPPAPLACAPAALVLADARPPALLALAPLTLVLADAHHPALLACAHSALVLADACPPALLAFAPLEDTRPPAIPDRAPGAPGPSPGSTAPARPASSPPREYRWALAVAQRSSWFVHGRGETSKHRSEGDDRQNCSRSEDDERQHRPYRRLPTEWQQKAAPSSLSSPSATLHDQVRPAPPPRLVRFASYMGGRAAAGFHVRN